MNKDQELILAIPTLCIKEIGMFQGFNPNGAAYIDKILEEGKANFTQRGPAEKNPGLKQIIPYCVIVQGGKIVIYQRGNSGGESRLKSLYSCGIGGHINPIDADENSAFTKDSLKRALLREIFEELELPSQNPKDISFKTAGLINDDSNPVGQVHLGLVEVALIKDGPILPREDAISNLQLVEPSQLIAMRSQLETWSQIVVDNIDKILANLGKTD